MLFRAIFTITIFSLCTKICRAIEKPEDLKVIIGGSPFLVHPKPEIRPTTPQSEFLPGVPPGYPNKEPIVTTTTPKYRPPANNNNNNNHHQKPNKPDNPFEWIINWFQTNKGSRDFLTNQTDASDLEFTQLNETQTAQIYEFLNMTQHNDTNEFQQLVHPNKGIFDWLLEVTGFGNKPNGSSNKPQKTCPSCACGQSFQQIRIVGGVETRVNAYPWMAYLTYNGRFYCGATVINNKYLLTAAHCVNGFNRDRLEITLLDHDRSTPFETTMTVKQKIANVFRHTRYNQGGSYNNDLALLKLENELQFTGLLRPVCLPTIGKSFTGYTGIVTGWGATQEHGQISNRLREVSVPILSNVNCRKTGYGNKITDNMLCAGYAEGNRDSCQGDSGGPLHVANNSAYQIVGIVSWGEGCAEANYPGVYTRVNRYLSWITANTRDACYCS